METEELTQLRTELDRVRKRESELLQELFDIRASAEIHNQKIDNITKLMRPVAIIDHLPVEVFSRILHFALHVARDSEWSLHRLQKGQFAGVSHRWRDVILNNPSLWSAICLCPSWPSSYVELHVARSHQHLLDITILEWWSFSDFGALFRPILRCTRRWRSLTIHCVVPSLLRDLGRLSLPHLKHVHVQSNQDFDAEFLTADNTPALEQSVLKFCRLPVTLFPSLEKLTSLTLYGKIGHWDLGPQPIRLPLLRSLKIQVDKAKILLEAIVAPELSHFDYRELPSLWLSPDFDGILPEFSRVHYVCLRSLTRKDSVATVCRAFPNVRHFKLGEHASGFFHGLRENTDLWGDLECVTFRSLSLGALEGAVTELQEWLRRRKPTAKPLHVRFTRIKRHHYWETTGYLLSMLYNSLHETCTFEVDQFPFTEQMRITSSARTLRMDLPHIPPCLVNMRSGQDVFWRESMDDFQDIPENESSDSEEDHGDGY
ncbi:hypothetical protein EDC04DRAFT_3146411 [Pisolithus marmoratus]|nr:hypothetical protein EDC04DRAFT_3146411 [Pisolithus marmoratus]